MSSTHRSRRWTFPLLALALLAQAGCGLNPADPDPSEFVLEVARALANQDWAAYESMAVDNTKMVLGSQDVLPTEGMAAQLQSADRARIRAGFDRIVRSGRLRPADAASYRATMTGSEVDRWVMRIEHADGTPTGVEVQVRRWHDSYKVLTVFERQ